MFKIRVLQLFSLSIIIALTACSKEEYESEEDFLEGVRDNAHTQTVKSEKGAVGPGSGQTPVIRVATTSYSMGNVPADRVTTRSMTISNDGEVPLIISDVTTSCHCTEGEMVEKEIAPGKSSELQIHFHPDRIPGQFHAKKFLTIFSNDPKMSQLQIAVETYVDPELKFEPKVLEIPAANAGQPTEGYITVFVLQETPITLTDSTFSQDLDFMTSSIVNPPKSEWADPEVPEIRILVKVDETAPVGTHKNMVRVTTNLVRFKKISIPVEVKIKGKYTFNPDSVTLRNIVPGEVQKNMLVLESEYPIVLKEMTYENSRFNIVSRTNEKNGNIEFDLTMSEEYENRLQKDNLVLKLEIDGEEYENTIRVVALVKRN